MRRRAAGFTLVEMLAAMAIGAVVVAAVSSLVFSAAKAVKAVDARRHAALENALVAVEKMKREIQSSAVISAARPLRVKASEISFFVPTSSDSTGAALSAEFRLGQVLSADAGPRLAKVTYAYDAERGEVTRTEEGGASRTVFSAADVRFSCAASEDAGSPPAWGEECAAPPSALSGIRVVVELPPPGRGRVERSFLIFSGVPADDPKTEDAV